MTRRAAHGLIAAGLLLGPFAALTALVLVTAPGVFSLDADIAAWLHRPALEHPELGSALELIGLLTQPNWLRLIALGAALQLWRSGCGRAAAWLVITMAIGGTLGVALKQVFARSRPEWPEAITVISGYSFPSGHAVNSMLAAGCAIVLLRPRLGALGRRRLWLVSGAFVLLVGFDRIALGVHYLTDVLAGWSLALALVFATLAAFGPFPVQPDSAGPPRPDDGPRRSDAGPRRSDGGPPSYPSQRRATTEPADPSTERAKGVAGERFLRRSGSRRSPPSTADPPGG
jgi:membrane-associated phospholipid phosphatase